MDQAEIRSFLRKYSAGGYSETEHSRFIEWLRTAPMKEIEKIAEEYRMIAEHRPLSENPQAQIIEQIESALNRCDPLGLSPSPVKAKVPIFRRIWRVGAAAAVAVLVVGLLSHWLLSKKTSENLNGMEVALNVQDVQAPRNTKATITLGNGQVIYLDSVNNGVLTKQGNVDIIKTTEEGIAYKSARGQEKQDEVAYNTLSNPRGSKVVGLTLADGTKVWLNAESSLHYPVAFRGNERKVQVTGEAYFEVTQNTAKRFLVDADGVITEVLGTHFNVNAYKEEGRTVVTLLEGAVRVEHSGSSVVIRPGQQAVANQDIRIIKDADLESAMAWKNGEFIMNSADVGSIMRQVARWYDVDVIYEEGVPEGKISGEVSRNLDLSQILQVLKYSGIRMKMEGRKVLVMP